MSVTVYLANKAFVLPATEGDISRRNAYFKNPTDPRNQLKPEEDKILLALGINKEQAPNLTSYLAKFFEQLPKCQTDASIMLEKDCEVIQSVLWETLFAARSRSKVMYDDNWKTKKPWGDISVAINEQIISDLKPKPSAAPTDIDKLFTLIFTEDVPVEIPQPSAPQLPSAEQLTASIQSILPIQPNANDQAVNKLFTLIFIDEEEPLPEPSAPEEIKQADAVSVSSTSNVSLPSVSTEEAIPSKTDITKEQLAETETEPKPTPEEKVNFEPVREPAEEAEPNVTETSSPFTKTQRNLPIGRTPSPLTVVPELTDLAEQCEGVDVSKLPYEPYEKEFNRSLYFFHSIKTQEPIELNQPSLSEATQTKFISDWQKAIRGSKNKVGSSLKFLGVPENYIGELDNHYRAFIYGGEPGIAHPIKAYGCEVKAETAAGYLARFIPIIEKTPLERTYYFEQSGWSAGGGSMVDPQTPKTVNELTVAIRDKEAQKRFTENEINDLHILTTHDINYSQSNSYNYAFQAAHIHELTLIKDLFAKNKNYVLDISPRLMYVLYKERYIERPLTGKEGTDTIENHFLKNAFKGQYEPPTLSEDPAIQEQVDVAFYEICHVITNKQSNPASFYSKPIQSKLSTIVSWLKSVKNEEFQTVTDAMKWVNPSKEPLAPAKLLELIQPIVKKPISFFSRMFTRKNSVNKKNAKNVTRKNKNNGVEMTKIQQPIKVSNAEPVANEVEEAPRKFSNTESDADEEEPPRKFSNTESDADNELSTTNSVPSFVKNSPGLHPVIEQGKLNLQLLRGESRKHLNNNNEQKLVLEEPLEPKKPGILRRFFGTRKLNTPVGPANANIGINTMYLNEQPEDKSEPKQKANKQTRKNMNFTNFMSKTGVTRETLNEAISDALKRIKTKGTYKLYFDALSPVKQRAAFKKLVEKIALEKQGEELKQLLEEAGVKE